MWDHWKSFLRLKTPLNLTPKNDNSVINLSSNFKLGPNESKLLQRGLFFIPTPSTFKDYRQTLRNDVSLYHRRLKLQEYFKDKPQQDPPPFQETSKWEPNLEWTATLGLNYLMHAINIIKYKTPTSPEAKKFSSASV
ncbi:hypothetical protein F7725_009352 [Dissostichus mawsoni]|uniref:Uncharacterized protein n=1 Tax=Dissostichus mawsoni TaxID=36200 RepID=A0A7J5Z7J7_DISMA|nr:hypothetical protein F7725_009352 [Dissostichus mawsoni]